MENLSSQGNPYFADRGDTGHDAGRSDSASRTRGEGERDRCHRDGAESHYRHAPMKEDDGDFAYGKQAATCNSSGLGGGSPPAPRQHRIVASTLALVAISRPSPRVSEAWFSDHRSPARRLHISWHGAERIIVLSIWHENRCTASFRLPVQDAGRMIAAVADAMSRAISVPSREIEQIQLPRWRSTLQHVQRLLRHRVGTERERPPGTGVRGMPIVDESDSISQAN